MQLKRNPESEFLRGEIVKERRALRRRGRFGVLASGGTLLLCSLTMGRALLSQQPLVVVCFILILMALLIWGLYHGSRIYSMGKMPVEETDIELRRQQERAFLFQAAQGQIPRSKGVVSLVIKGGLGLAFLGWALYIWVIYRDHLAGFPLYFVCLMVPSGMGLVGGAVSDWRKRLKLVRESADILAERLMLGEITEGSGEEKASEGE